MLCSCWGGRVHKPTASIRFSEGSGAAGAQVQGDLRQVMRGNLYPAQTSSLPFRTKIPRNKARCRSRQPLPILWASTYGGWTAVENAGIALAEAANLLILPGRKCRRWPGRPATECGLANVGSGTPPRRPERRHTKQPRRKNQDKHTGCGRRRDHGVWRTATRSIVRNLEAKRTGACDAMPVRSFHFAAQIWYKSSAQHLGGVPCREPTNGIVTHDLDPRRHQGRHKSTSSDTLGAGQDSRSLSRKKSVEVPLVLHSIATYLPTELLEPISTCGIPLSISRRRS